MEKHKLHYRVQRIDEQAVPLGLDEHEEQVYWSPGVASTEPSLVSYPRLMVYTTERAAWIGRERLIERGWPTYSLPYHVTKEIINERAQRRRLDRVDVLDESGEIVDWWTVRP